MTEDDMARLLGVIARDDGASIPKVAKKLALSQSQLLRSLLVLGRSEVVEGLGLVDVRGDDPPRLFLTEDGRKWLEQRHEA
jgi:hypothetical protein